MKLFSALSLSTALPVIGVGLSLSFAGCKALDTQTPTPVSETMDTVLMAQTPVPQTGMVAAANPHATQAGLDVLRAGGSAVDAAVAVQTVLGLVEPQSSGLGGGAFMMVYDSHNGEVWTYDGREEAPSDITSSLFLDSDGNPIGRLAGIASGISTGAPGAVAMLGRAHDDYGILEWAPLLEPALTLAENGFEISPRMAGILSQMSHYALNRQAEARNYFFQSDGVTPHPAGFVRDNPAYAQTLRAIQTNPRALLEGPVAEQIIAAIREEPRPGTLTLEDMAQYQPHKRPALCSPYREYTVCGAQPPASGGIAVQSVLGVLEHFDMAQMGQTIQGWHHFIEASFMAYADRDKYVADDRFVTVPVNAMLDREYLESRARLIRSDSAIADVKAGDLGPAGQDATPDNPGTSHFTIVDKNGLVVSMTTTVESAFGSQRMAGGFVLNNQLTDFSFRAFDADGLPIANAPAPGKRPRSSMAPSLVFDKDGQFLFSTGSPGGSSIIAYTAKTIVGVLDWSLTPQQAIELPNVIARNGSVRLENGLMDANVVEGLESLGHKIVRSKGEISGIHMIYRHSDGTLIGGADPRREGTAKLQ